MQLFARYVYVKALTTRFLKNRIQLTDVADERNACAGRFGQQLRQLQRADLTS